MSLPVASGSRPGRRWAQGAAAAVLGLVVLVATASAAAAQEVDTEPASIPRWVIIATIVGAVIGVVVFVAGLMRHYREQNSAADRAD